MSENLSGCFTDVSLEKPITTPAEAKEFLSAAIRVLGLAFHPDNPFGDYVVGCRQLPMFSPAVAELLEARRAEVCEVLGDGVYDAAMATPEWLKASGC